MSAAPELPIGFAHRGGARERRLENTVAAFSRARALGATGIESDVEVTADGIIVLVHPGILARLRRPVAGLRRDQLPGHVPTLEELYRVCGADLDVALDMAAPKAVDQVVATARTHGDPSRLWLTYWHVDALARWRRSYPDVRLVFPALALRRAGLERRCAALRGAGVDAINLYHRACTPARTAVVHDGGLLLFGWGARTGAAAARTLRSGADGVFCDDTTAMVDVLDVERRRRARRLSGAR